FQQRPESATARCEFCPLFYALEGRSEDLGCRSVLDPILAAVRQGNTQAARARVEELIRTLEEMTLPEGDDPPVPPQLIEAVRATGEHLPRDRRPDPMAISCELPTCRAGGSD